MISNKGNSERIYKAVRYAEQNLDKNTNLDDLAAIACFSPFHFQRIFKDIVGETPKQFIKRLRLEKAAHIIVLNLEKSILEIAVDVGFQSLEAFSRAFKDYYSVSPDNFRKSEETEKLRIIRNPNLHRKLFDEPDCFLAASVSQFELDDLDIKVVKQPALRFVYLQTTFESSQVIDENFRKIKKWCEGRDFIKPTRNVFGIIMDYPLFTALDKCRYLTCVPVESKPNISGLVNYGELPLRTYATFSYTGGISDLIKAATYFAHQWLPDSGYKIIQESALHIPINNPLSTLFDKNTYQVFIQIQSE